MRLLGFEELLQPFSTQGLRTFDWKSQGPIPDQWGAHTESSRHSKEYGEEAHLGHIEMLWSKESDINLEWNKE